MKIPENLPVALLWIAVILASVVPIVVLAFMFLFRHEMRERLKQIDVTYLGGRLMIGFGDASIDKLDQQRSLESKAESVAKAEQPRADSIKWSNTGNLFWATHDLMLTIDRLLRAAPKEAIFFTLQQSLWHVRALGFKGPPIESKLTELTARAAGDLDFPYPIWPPEMRDYYATELESIKNEIGHLARANQRDFDPGPKIDHPVLDLHEWTMLQIAKTSRPAPRAALLLGHR